jgi:hypothetical protein
MQYLISNGPLHLKRKLHQVIKLRSNYDWNKRLQRNLKQNYVHYSTKQHKEIKYHHQLIRYIARQLARTWY